MSQDSAGITPAAVGQPVGFIGDKRLGAGASDISGFAAFNEGAPPGTATYNATTGAGQLYRTDAANKSNLRKTGLTANTWYRINVTNTSASSVSVRTNGGGTTVASIAPGATVNVCFSTAASTDVVLVADINATNPTVTVNSFQQIPGNHATQATAASRPTLRQDASGYYYLEFDGIDDSLAMASVDFSATDKMTVFAGVNKASDAAFGMLVEHSANSSATTGAFYLGCSAAGTYQLQRRANGASAAQADSAAFAAPHTAVVSASIDFAAVQEVQPLRVNGAASGPGSSTDTGGGTFGNYPLYIGRRGGSTLPFNGRIYSLVVRGAATDAALTSRAERFVGSRMGIAL